MSWSGCFRTSWLSVCLAVAWINSARATEARTPAPTRATYTVQAGDALSVIAEQQGVSLALLRKVNDVSSDTIRAGQVLVLPTLYEVKPGDVLGTIAERHRVPLNELYLHNDLHEGSVLKVGQRLIIPGGTRDPSAATRAVPDQGEFYVHEVRPGEALSVIAARYEVPTKELCQINQVNDAALIRVGQRLNIPVTDTNAHLTRPKSWSKYARRNFKRGTVTLTTQGGNWTGKVMDDKGNVLPEARKHIQSLLASWETGKKVQVALHPRLYELIVTVSDEFGGRPIRVVSGYRQRSYARHSKHRVGRALDFSIPGVPNTAVVDFLLTLPNTGVGYYPNTTHVHMDARASRMYWVDVSGPGQSPRYVHKSNTGERSPAVSAAKSTRRGLRSNASGSVMARLDRRRR